MSSGSTAFTSNFLIASSTFSLSISATTTSAPAFFGAAERNRTQPLASGCSAHESSLAMSLLRLAPQCWWEIIGVVARRVEPRRATRRTLCTRERRHTVMPKVGYFLACEEFGPKELLRQARMAEEAGFEALWISDHYHPWTEAQGNSPFVWSVIGGLSQATSLPVTTGVTCPTVRMHTAIIAQAAATSAVMLEGRFVLGVGSGENLNEHILGDRWPETDVRLEMLEEAVEVIRTLWQGGDQSHHGRHYTVENARVYDLPDEPPRILVSGFGPKAIAVAARIGDGFCTTSPDKDAIDLYRSEGGKGPVHGGTKVCF